MSYRGDIALDATIDLKFSTVNASGVPTTLAGSPVISAYIGNSTTQITAGITLTVDFDGVTGLHHVRVVATSLNGYTTPTNVDLVLTVGTVNSVSVVGMVVGSFSIEARPMIVASLATQAKADVNAEVDTALVDFDALTAGEIADAFLARDLVGGSSASSRNVRNALRSLRNKVAIVAGTATVYEENDTTAAWTAAITTAAGNPISVVDPA